MKTAELTGTALDWAVVKCEGATNLRRNPHKFDTTWIYDLDFDGVKHTDYLANYTPSKTWSDGGPIIEREFITVMALEEGGWTASVGELWIAEDGGICGKTPLEAAMRCYVASKLGDEIEIPEGLLGT